MSGPNEHYWWPRYEDVVDQSARAEPGVYVSLHLPGMFPTCPDHPAAKSVLVVHVDGEERQPDPPVCVECGQRLFRLTGRTKLTPKTPPTPRRLPDRIRARLRW